MPTERWPDPLQKPEPAQVEQLLNTFWQQLRNLPDLINRGEQLLAQECTVHLRQTVIEMMLALNGIQHPVGTAHLNTYLGESQRAALEKTLHVPEVASVSWIGQAVALVVIYRWYAPQLMERYGLIYPQALEEQVWLALVDQLPDWPENVTTES